MISGFWFIEHQNKVKELVSWLPLHFHQLFHAINRCVVQVIQVSVLIVSRIFKKSTLFSSSVLLLLIVSQELMQYQSQYQMQWLLMLLRYFGNIALIWACGLLCLYGSNKILWGSFLLYDIPPHPYSFTSWNFMLENPRNIAILNKVILRQQEINTDFITEPAGYFGLMQSMLRKRL